jgi:DNA-binding protein H-NS
VIKIPDLTKLNTKQLHEVIAKAQELIELRRAEDLKEGKAKIAAIAKELGVSMQALLGSRNGKASNGKHSIAQPKYRSKKDPNLTWSGRGRMATWLADEVKAGKRKEHFLIKK